MSRHVSTLSVLMAFLLVASLGVALAETADEAALRGAAGDEKLGEVERLLDKGTSPNVPDHNGRTAVNHAAVRANAAILEALLEAGGDPDAQDALGSTPLHLAADFPYVESDSQLSVRTLLSYGADPDLADREGRTPLHLVAEKHKQATSVRDLVSSGADVNATDRRGDTPLHYAIGRSSKFSPDVVGVLVIVGGADVNVRGGSGETPLQLFVRVGTNDGRVANIFVNAGADIDGKNPDGETPLHTAIRNGGSRENDYVVEALLEKGADPCIRDASGYIPYNTAHEGGWVHTMLANAGGSDSDCQGAEVPVADYVVDPADWRGETTARANIRSGPGTDHDVVSTLAGGTPVHVTGTVRNTDWLRADVAGATAFVHASLVEEIAPPDEAEGTAQEDAGSSFTDTTAPDLPSPETCAIVTEIDALTGGDWGEPMKQVEIANQCSATVLLYIVFVERFQSDWLQQYGGTAVIGEIASIGRIPGTVPPEQSELYGSIIAPGGSTLYPAYGPIQDDQGNWHGEYFACVQYHPLSVHEAAGYASCKASKIPEFYWGCPDGTPYPSEVTDKHDMARFCRDRE